MKFLKGWDVSLVKKAFNFGDDSGSRSHDRYRGMFGGILTIAG